MVRLADSGVSSDQLAGRLEPAGYGFPIYPLAPREQGNSGPVSSALNRGHPRRNQKFFDCLALSGQIRSLSLDLGEPVYKGAKD